MKLSSKGLSAAIALALASGLSSQAQAAGFALIENSASGMGNAFAGAAAIGEDASTVYFNPAAMTRLSGNNISVAGHTISTSADFTNEGSTSVSTAPLSGTDDDGGVNAIVPNFYYTNQLSDYWTFGLGVNAPFGLETNYDEDWVGRYSATKSEVMTLNINPSLAAKVSDKFSLGFGFNIQYMEATLANQMDSGAICTKLLASDPTSGFYNDVNGAATDCAVTHGLVIGSSAVDSSQSLNGDSWSWGMNIGMLYDISESTTLGVAYRSAVSHGLDGNVDFSRSTELDTFLTGNVQYNALFNNNTPGIESTTQLPDTLSVSVTHAATDKMVILGDITWTDWSKFDELKIEFDNEYQTTSTTPENWGSSLRFSVGMNYQASDAIKYRVGLALDQTPIGSAEERTARIPGNDRTWISLGMGYKFSPEMSMDVGYSHLMVDDTPIDNTDAFGNTLTGTYEADVDILSVQGNFKF